MRFPEELWSDPTERQLVSDLVVAFQSVPLMLTDRLVNVVYINDTAEKLLDDHAEALVNRLSLSLLGFGRKERVPDGLMNALLGKAGSWRGIVDLAEEGPPRQRYAEASAVVREGRLVCGVIRLSTKVQKPSGAMM